jgi:hypothetical protein
MAQEYITDGGESPLGTTPSIIDEPETATLGAQRGERGENQGSIVKFTYVKTLGYDNHWFISAPYGTTETILEMLRDLDFPRVPETLIMSPTTNALIELDRTIMNDTPTVLANAQASWPLHAKEVHVQAAPGALAGVLMCWGFW